ncbi:MAG: deoxyribose-phosphate aldolase [Phycisphaerae bacterium]|nr:deoxyribose-phosphate aldolase [Phycisphaerae bacterium]
MTVPDVAKYIDHTLLRQDASPDEIVTLCRQAKQHKFTAVCVNPSYVALAALELEGTPIKVCTVIGFPLGATTTQTKAFETREAIANGASEVDMVINLGALKSGNKDLVVRDIAEVVAAAGGAMVKVIIETGLLTRDQKILACQLVKQAGAHFVKTCTGFAEGFATVEDIRLLRETVGPGFGVKASGKVRDYANAQALLAAGATRIGAGYGVKIVEGEAAAR